jgi:S1-C subfamily serine protease
MKKLFLFVALLSAGLCKAGEPDKTLHEKCLYPTVLVWSDQNTGSGVIVKSVKKGEKYHNTVFSAAHVFTEVQYQGEPKPRLPPYRIYVPRYKNWSALDGYDEYPITVHRLDRDSDAVVVTFDSDKEMKVADLNWKPNLFIGNSVTHVGGGLGAELRVDHGEITSVRYDGGKGFPKGMYRTNVYTLPGDSGGPLYHEHKLVGICQSIRIRYWNVGNTRIDVPISKFSMYFPLSLFTEKDLEN